MTKKELIEKLKDYPDNVLIVVDGYEEGYDDPRITECELKLNANPKNNEHYKSYYGVHAYHDDYYHGDIKNTKAILLQR